MTAPKVRRDGFQPSGPTYTMGLLWICNNDPHVDLTGLRYSDCVMLLASLFKKSTAEVAMDVFNMRKKGG